MRRLRNLITMRASSGSAPEVPETNMIFHANMSQLNASYAAGSVTGTNSGAVVSGGIADLTASNSYIAYSATSNTASTTGCIRVKAKVAHNKSSMLYYQDSGAEYDTASIAIYVSNGSVFIAVQESNGVFPDLPYLVGTWPNDTNYHEVELNYNLSTGHIYTFIDGVLADHTTGAGTLSGTVSLMRVGQERVLSSGYAGFVDDLKIYNAVQHTTNYTPS